MTDRQKTVIILVLIIAAAVLILNPFLIVTVFQFACYGVLFVLAVIGLLYLLVKIS